MSLSMRERLTLQKQVKTNLAALRGGEAGMRERLRLQKEVKADIAKLKGVGAGSQEPKPAPLSSLSPGDAVEWRNEMGTIRGSYRGATDDGKHAMIVHDGGQQTAAPIGEVFAATGEPGNDDAQAATLTTQAVEGNFNALPLPDFIVKLKEAYSADEDLEGAKGAAVGYLEANRAELEEAA